MGCLTPPPPPIPSLATPLFCTTLQVDKQIESGEYFLKPKEKEAAEKRARTEGQSATSLERQSKKRQEAFVVPEEERGADVKDRVREKRKREKREREE